MVLRLETGQPLDTRCTEPASEQGMDRREAAAAPSPAALPSAGRPLPQTPLPDSGVPSTAAGERGWRRSWRREVWLRAD